MSAPLGEGRAKLSPAILASIVPFFVAIAALVVVSLSTNTELAIVGWIGLFALGIAPTVTLTEIAGAELSRGNSFGRFPSRVVVLIGAGSIGLIAAVVIAFALFPVPLVYVALQGLATVPAIGICAHRTILSHRLPVVPFSGKLLEIRWRS